MKKKVIKLNKRFTKKKQWKHKECTASSIDSINLRINLTAVFMYGSHFNFFIFFNNLFILNQFDFLLNYTIDIILKKKWASKLGAYYSKSAQPRTLVQTQFPCTHFGWNNIKRLIKIKCNHLLSIISDANR